MTIAITPSLIESFSYSKECCQISAYEVLTEVFKVHHIFGYWDPDASDSCHHLVKDLDVFDDIDDEDTVLELNNYDEDNLKL